MSMSDAPFRTRLGRMELVSSDGQCKVLVEDGSSKKGVDPLAVAAQAEAEAKRKAAYQEGWKACEKKFSAELADLKKRLDAAQTQIPQALNAYLREFDSQMKEEVVELSFKAARAIVGCEMERRDITAAVLADALKPLLSLQGVKLHLNPALVATGAQAAGIPAGVGLVSDPKLAMGEVIVESPQGFIDGTVEGRLQTLKEALMKSISERGDA